MEITAGKFANVCARHFPFPSHSASTKNSCSVDICENDDQIPNNGIVAIHAIPGLPVLCITIYNTRDTHTTTYMFRKHTHCYDDEKLLIIL
jgi:hypothetical protein